MRNRSSRELIHSYLEAGQVDLLLAAAIHVGGNALHDSDVFRALMQLALQEGDLETVRQTATRMLDVALGLGQLPMALEAICLFRNVGGDASHLVTRLVDEVRARGFDSEQIPSYVDWSFPAEVDEALMPCPTPVDGLAMLSERPAPKSTAPFAWVPFWSQLPVEEYQTLIQWIHFELRRSNEAVLSAPRLVACWVTSGSLNDGEGSRLLAPGTMVTPRTTIDVESNSHLRMIGVREANWTEILEKEPFATVWRELNLRHRSSETLHKIAARHRLPASVVETLLRQAQLSHGVELATAKSQDAVALLLDGIVEGTNHRTASAGELVRIPAGSPVQTKTFTGLVWTQELFEKSAPLSMVDHQSIVVS